MAVEWIAVGILVFIGLLLLKIEHHTRKYKILGIILIGLIVYLSMVGIFTSEQVDLTSPRGIVNAVYLYFGWIGETSMRLWDIGTETTHMVGNAVKVDNPEEENKRR